MKRLVMTVCILFMCSLFAPNVMGQVKLSRQISIQKKIEQLLQKSLHEPQEALKKEMEEEWKTRRQPDPHRKGQWVKVPEPHFLGARIGYAIPYYMKWKSPAYKFEWHLAAKYLGGKEKAYRSFMSFIHEEAQKLPSYNLLEEKFENSDAREATIALCVLIESDRPYRLIFQYLFRKGASVLAERTDGSGNLTEIAAIKFGHESPITKVLFEQAEKERQHKKQ